MKKIYDNFNKNILKNYFDEKNEKIILHPLFYINY